VRRNLRTQTINKNKIAELRNEDEDERDEAKDKGGVKERKKRAIFVFSNKHKIVTLPGTIK